jgi:prophage regulatory protein
LRLSDVEQKSGFKRSLIYNLMSQGKSPKSARLGVRAVGWDAAEIDQWIADRLQDRT